jgi:cysteine desulfurase
MRRIYLDHNATTRLHPDARRAMAPFLDREWGNPSSRHAEGRAAREALEQARDRVARLVGARSGEIVFTSGGTEADRLAVLGAALAARANHPRRARVIASPLEHVAVEGALALLTARGFAVEKLRADPGGRVDPDELGRKLGDDVALVTVQLANHEIGTLQPIAELAERARAAGALFHSDAVQAAGKLPLDVAALGVDLLAISAHKLYGPKGAGALWLRSGIPFAGESGGHQERGRRGGTEDVAAAVGFGAAAEAALRDGAGWSAHVTSLRDRFEAGAVASGAQLNGDRAARVGNTSSLAWPGAEGALVMESLDLEGVAVSTGAACTSGSLAPSPVLLALGQDRTRALEAVRFSFGRENSDQEVDAVLALLAPIVARVRAATA